MKSYTDEELLNQYFTWYYSMEVNITEHHRTLYRDTLLHLCDIDITTTEDHKLCSIVTVAWYIRGESRNMS